MTPVELLEELKGFIEKHTKDIILQVRTRRGNEEISRAAEVHKMKLPTKSDETERIPYILLQVLNGKDDADPGKARSSNCKIRIVVATYSEDGGEGSYDVLNLLMRIRFNLLKTGILADKFILKHPLEYIIYPEDTSPYYLGEMMTEWSIPSIEREVNLEW